MEEDLENTETGTWNEYKRFAISDYNYAAKELDKSTKYDATLVIVVVLSYS